MKKRISEREYAIYRGDKFIMIGTGRECAAYLGVDVKSVAWYSYPSYRRCMEKAGNEDYLIVLDLDKIPDDDGEYIRPKPGRKEKTIDLDLYKHFKEEGYTEKRIAEALGVSVSKLGKWKLSKKKEGVL